MELKHRSGCHSSSALGVYSRLSSDGSFLICYVINMTCVYAGLPRTNKAYLSSDRLMVYSFDGEESGNGISSIQPLNL